MTLSELATMVCTKVGKTDDASIAACKDYIRARHEMVVDSFPWKDTLGVFEVAVEAESQHAILPAEAGRPWAVWDKDGGLEVPVGSLAATIQTSPNALEDVGGLAEFVEVESVGWAYPLASSGSVLSFINTGLAEVTVNISGERDLGFAGLPTLPDMTTTEALVIAASGTVLSSSWKVIHRMHKPQGADILIAQLGTIPEKTWAWPSESREAVFGRIRLISPPREAVTLGVLAKRKTRQMVLDSDGPMVRGVDNALIAFAQADMLERSRQYQKAAAKVAEGTALVDGARDLERNQSAKSSRVVPWTEVGEADNWSQW